MEYLIDGLIIIFSIIGLIGCLIPIVPGPPMNYAALLIAYFYYPGAVSENTLYYLGALTAVTVASDYILPMMGIKYLGIGKGGMWGSFIGMIAGVVLFPPFGFLIGAAIGAVAGEIIGGKGGNEALRAGMAAFILNIAAIVFKLIIAAFIAIKTILAIV